MNIQKDISLSNYTTFRTGGPADYFCEVATREDLIKCFDWIKREKINFFCLGNGSNLLVNDSGFRGVVIKIVNSRTIWGNSSSCSGVGIILASLINEAKNRNLGGMEWAFGIPATLGGAITNNAGAYGSDMAKLVESVEVFDVGNGNFCLIGNNECGFSYRESVFKKRSDWIIWEVKLLWQEREREEINRNINFFLEQRRRKQPLNKPSAGSFFRNPTIADLGNHKKDLLIESFVRNELKKATNKGGKKDLERTIRENFDQSNTLPAAYLIERAGLKGKGIGGAQVSKKHANFIINTGNAKTEDIIILASIIKQKVRTKFEVQLHEEVEYVGF